MTPKIAQNTETNTVQNRVKLVIGTEPATGGVSRPAMRPEVRAALEASWKRNEAAYRYLG